MSRTLCTFGLIVIATFLAVGAGYELQSSNPEGIWLYTPPADGSGEASNALYVGATLGLLLSAIIYTASFVSMFAWAKLKSRALPAVFIPFGVAALTSVVIIAILSELTW